MPWYAIVVISVLCVLIVWLMWQLIKSSWGKSKLFGSRVSSLSAKETMDQFLESMGCKPNVISENDNESWISFYFQGGYFYAHISYTDNYIGLRYDRFYGCDSSELDRVMNKCIYETRNMKVVKVLPLYDEEDNKVYFSLSYEGFNMGEKEISDFLNLAPRIGMQIRDEFDKEDTSMEERANDNRRFDYILREAELKHQDVEIIANPVKPLSIGQLIETLFEMCDEVKGKTMSAYSESRSEYIDDPKVIDEYDVLDLVYNKESGELYHRAMVSVTSENYHYTFHLDAKYEDEFTVYIRVTATQAALDVNQEFMAIKTITPVSISCLVAYDKSSEENRHNEFEYMWLDAQDKIKKGKMEELSEEQRILVDAEKTEDWELIYFAHKYFLRGRYYEALVLFMNVFKRLKTDFFRRDTDGRKAIMDLCFRIGFCLCELKQYDLAYTFLDFARKEASFNNVTEYINCLVNNKDIRGFKEIDDLLDFLKDELEKSKDSDDVNVEYIKLHDFLMRRRGYLCIEYGYLDAAEDIFKRLVGSPLSDDYAKDELEYIAELKRRKERDECLRQIHELAEDKVKARQALSDDGYDIMTDQPDEHQSDSIDNPTDELSTDEPEEPDKQ